MAMRAMSELRESLRQVERFGFEGSSPSLRLPGLSRDRRLITEEARKLGLTVWERDDQEYPCGYTAARL